MKKSVALSLLTLLLGGLLASAAFAESFGGEMKKAEKGIQKGAEKVESVVKKDTKKVGSVFKKGAKSGKSLKKTVKK